MPVSIDVETTEMIDRAETSPVTRSIGSSYGSAYGATPYHEAYDAVPDLLCDDDDDEPPRLPPPPARGSRNYAVPSVPRDVGAAPPVVIRPRARATIAPPVPSRRPQRHTPVENEAVYQAVLRHFR